MTDRVAADQVSRRLAQSEFERAVVVVAGAGTGKTALLVSRVVVWCVGPGWERHAGEEADHDSAARRVIERVVAITFTEAAAAEMARKIGTALIDLARGESPIGWDPEPGLLPSDEDELRARARALSEEGHRLVVSTIHAFCQRLLSTYPLEAGLHPRFEVDPEGARLESLAEELVEETLRGLDDDPNRSSWERLAVEGVGPPEVVAALCDLSEAGADPAFLEEDPFGDAAARATIERLGDALDAFSAAAGDCLDPLKGEVSIVTRDAVAQLIDWSGTLSTPPSFGDLCNVVSSLDNRVVARLRKWSKLDLTGSETSCLGDTAYEVAAAAGRLAAVLVPLVDLQREQAERSPCSSCTAARQDGATSRGCRHPQLFGFAPQGRPIAADIRRRPPRGRCRDRPPVGRRVPGHRQRSVRDGRIARPLGTRGTSPSVVHRR